MIKRRNLRTRSIKMFILDEADEMLNKGFKEQIYDVYRYYNYNSTWHEATPRTFADLEVWILSNFISPQLLISYFCQIPAPKYSSSPGICYTASWRTRANQQVHDRPNQSARKTVCFSSLCHIFINARFLIFLYSSFLGILLFEDKISAVC